MTRRADMSAVSASFVGADRPPWGRLRAPYGSRRVTTDLTAIQASAIVRATLAGRGDGVAELDVEGRRAVLGAYGVVRIDVDTTPSGAPRFWAVCHGCDRRTGMLYVDAPGLRGRRCARLVLPSSRNRAEDRAVPLALAHLARARERIGADPAPGAPLPPRVRCWPKRTWELHLRRIREAEAAVQQALDAAVARAAAKLGALAEVADGGGKTGPCGASRNGGSRGVGRRSVSREIDQVQPEGAG